MRNFDAFRIAEESIQKAFLHYLVVFDNPICEWDCSVSDQCKRLEHDCSQCSKEWLDKEYDIETDVFELKKGTDIPGVTFHMSGNNNRQIGFVKKVVIGKEENNDN